MKAPVTPPERYAARPWQFCGVQGLAGWQLKTYRIWYPAREPVDWAIFANASDALEAALPQPPSNAQRSGVGFVIAHAGRGVDYLLLNWWDNENEWRHRIWIRELKANRHWHEPKQGESACVWDLALIHFEREACVDWLLGRRDFSAAQYLATVPAPGQRW